MPTHQTNPTGGPPRVYYQVKEGRLTTRDASFAAVEGVLSGWDFRNDPGNDKVKPKIDFRIFLEDENTIHVITVNSLTVFVRLFAQYAESLAIGQTVCVGVRPGQDNPKVCFPVVRILTQHDDSSEWRYAEKTQTFTTDDQDSALELLREHEACRRTAEAQETPESPPAPKSSTQRTKPTTDAAFANAI